VAAEGARRGLALVLEIYSVQETGIHREGMGANNALHREVQSGEEMEKEKEIDFIRLKKIREPNVKDEQDIAYLLKAKELFKK
jgi:hypothetical protein